MEWKVLKSNFPPSSVTLAITDLRRRHSGGQRVQCIGAGDHHPSWHGHRVGRPHQQPGQASGGILPRSRVRWLDESGSLQVPLDRAYSAKALGSLGHGSTFVNMYQYNAFCSSEGHGDFQLRRLGSLLGFLCGWLSYFRGSQHDLGIHCKATVQPYERSTTILMRCGNVLRKLVYYRLRQKFQLGSR
ncbi:hypothetical protein TNCV_1170211 [Trichonephila clavipes]|nr:hypothetical protein TNCV_1170211 [Trichonephila clavipes]